MRLVRVLPVLLSVGLLAVACGDSANPSEDDDDGSGAGAGGASVGSGGSGDGGALVPCDGGFLCGEACLDLMEDPLNCGGCDVACGAGEICVAGGCTFIADCTETPCTGLSYCDLATKQCLPGCIDDMQCGGGQVCDLPTHGCVCPGGTHLCSGVCSSDTSPLTCGASCTPCALDANGDASCNAGQCGLSCDAGFHLCGDNCADDTAPATCGSSCSPCPTDLDGQATCDAGQCGLACDPGFWSCADGCCGFSQETIATGNPSAVDIQVSGAAVHVAYNGSPAGAMYGLRAGGVWTTQSVDVDGTKHASIALTPSGEPWIAFTSRPAQSSRMHVARKSGGGFSIDDVTGTGCCATGAALTIDPTGTARLAYNYDGSNNGGSIRLYENSGGSWTYRGVSPINHQGNTEIGAALDPSNNLHVGFSASFGGTTVTVWNGSMWTYEQITEPSGGDVAIGYGGGAGALVSCNSSGLRLGTLAGTWTQETLSAASTSVCDIAVDGSGRPHVVSISAGSLVYRTLEGAVWKTIDLASGVTDAAVTVDAMGNPHIVYDDGANVRYAFAE